MGKKRRRHSDEFKAKVALEAVKGIQTLSELSSKFGVHPTVIAHWKRQLVEGASELFSRGDGRRAKTEEEIAAPLYEKIGRLEVEVDWLKKKALSPSLEVKRKWIDVDYPELSIARQCALAGLARSSYYFTPMATESAENLRLMRQIDKLYLKRPFYGYRRISGWLRELGWDVNTKRVARLMRLMGLQAVLPGPHTSRRHPEHRVYPYLLRDLTIRAPDEVWCADITYMPMKRGFLYLVAVMDWFSRYVLAWELSNSLEATFCLEALNRALAKGSPGIFNTDQGTQFTSEDFTGRLESEGVRVSMDGRGRVLDNIFIERLWRSVKYEDIYLHDYADGIQAIAGLNRYFRFYNTRRPHQALGNRTPSQIYTEKVA